MISKGDKRMDTILKLWRGEISQEALRCACEKEKEEGEIAKEVMQEAEAFEKSLTEEQKKWSLSHWIVESEEWSKEVDMAFVRGFQIGAKLMMDVLERH